MNDNLKREVPAAILGSAQAEADSAMLRDAFVETADYLALRRTTDYNFVVGRRGTGKSAMFDRLGTELASEQGATVISVLPQDYEMVEAQNRLRSLGQGYLALKVLSRLAWSVAVLRHAAKEVRKHYKYCKLDEAERLDQLLAAHDAADGPTVCSSYLRILRIAAASGASGDELPGRIAETFSVAELQEAVRAALDLTGVRIFLLFDRLDEAWQGDLASVSGLGGLIRAAAEFRERRMRLHVVLFVRDNMFRAVAQQDEDFTRHVEGHALRLHWDHDSLFHLVVARLRVAIDMRDKENPTKVWNRFAASDLQGRDGFARCLQFTLFRPRDILVLLNQAYLCAQRDMRSQIVLDDLEKSARHISQFRLEDLFKEYDRVMPGLRAFVGSFKSRAAMRPLAEVVAQLDRVLDSDDQATIASRDVSLFVSGAEAFSALYSVGFVGIRDPSHSSYLFCHDGTTAALPLMESTLSTLVHPCYWKALETVVDVEVEDVLISVSDEYEVPQAEQQVEGRLRRIARTAEELTQIPVGVDGAKAFESWALRAIRVLFSGSLTNLELKPNGSGALNQRDIVGTNHGKSDLWRRLLEDYKCRQVVFECKNYEQLAPDDFRQVLDYMSGEYGSCCFIVRRGGSLELSETDRSRMRSLYYEHQKLVIVLPSELLVLCIRKVGKQKSYDYAEHQLAKHLDSIVRGVLSLSHTPTFRKAKNR